MKINPPRPKVFLPNVQVLDGQVGRAPYGGARLHTERNDGAGAGQHLGRLRGWMIKIASGFYYGDFPWDEKWWFNMVEWDFSW